MQRGLSALVAAVAGGAVLLQGGLIAAERGLLPALSELSGYFTIWANVVLAVLGLVLAAGGRVPAWLAAGALLWIGLVAGVHHLLLAHRQEVQGLRAVADAGLHSLAPLLYALLWWRLPKQGLAMRHLLPWAAFPLAFALHALIRGAATGWYPYPFLDVATLGAAGVLAWIALLAAAFLAAGVALPLALRVAGQRG